MRRHGVPSLLGCRRWGNLPIPMINPTIKELAGAKAKVAQLEHSLIRELASLPAAYGFDSLRAFITALHEASSGSGRAAKKGGKGTGRKTRKRATDNDATRARVKQLVKAGKSGSQVAIALGISLPSVQNIKKALGLVRSSKKAFMKPKAPAKVVPKAKKKGTAPKKAAVAAQKPSQTTVVPAPAPAA